MIAADTTNGNTDNWQFQGPSFLAWITPQEFTVPFYQLTSPATGAKSDFIFLPAVNSSAPTAPGFSVQGIVGYAYSTQICGSVPLLLAVNTGATDSWWTTSQADYDLLLETNTGWSDAGIAFYVLPLGTSTYICPIFDVYH